MASTLVEIWVVKMVVDAALLAVAPEAGSSGNGGGQNVGIDGVVNRGSSGG